MIVTLDGCYFFKVTKTDPNQMQSLYSYNINNKFYILHANDSVWNLNHPVFSNDTIKGTLVPLIGHRSFETANPEKANRFKIQRGGGASVTDEVHIYIDTCCYTANSSLILPIKSIKKVEVYDMAKGATAASWIAGMTAATVGALGIFLLILILTKESCPFIYVFDGTDYSFVGEIFSGATQPVLNVMIIFHCPGWHWQTESTDS
jgi:hypothetical protein